MLYRDMHTGEELREWELEERYDDMLNEVYGDIELAGLTYSTARTLKLVDPIAYRTGFLDWIDGETGETLEEIEG